MSAQRVLVADDEREIQVSCRKILERCGYDVTTANDGAEAIEALKGRRHALFLVDLKMPGPSGLDVLSAARSLDPAMAIVMITAHATLETAVEAVKRGAFDYLAKPFTADQLRLAAERALRHKRLAEENLNLREQLANDRGFDRILGTSEAIRKVFATLQRVMRSDANILLGGETGTGKELVARTIHAHSLRAEAPFVAVDCAALPETLLENELFGHERGAFTGADRATRGLMELAHTGTLFLDEIGELTSTLQARLLRTLQEREIRRVGGEKTVAVDIRVIAATNRDLRAEVARKAFREDLYYRLHVIGVQLPPLRERHGDIPLLANRFLAHFRDQTQRTIRAFSPDVMKLFLTHTWPGNIRELQNVVHHAVLLAETEEVELHDLPDYLRPASAEPLSLRGIRARHAESLERPFLEELLRKHGGNVSEAAAEGQMTRKMVYRLAKKLGIPLGQFRPS